jgi:hypothetical protein
VAQNVLAKMPCTWRVRHINTIPEVGNRGTTSFQCSCVRERVHALRHSADNDPTGVSKRGSDFLGDSDGIGNRVSCSDNGNRLRTLKRANALSEGIDDRRSGVGLF